MTFIGLYCANLLVETHLVLCSSRFETGLTVYSRQVGIDFECSLSSW